MKRNERTENGKTKVFVLKMFRIDIRKRRRKEDEHDK